MINDPQADVGVLVMSGPPCAGKSTVGRVLSTGRFPSQPRWIYLEVDSLFGLLLPESDRSRDDRMLAYDAAHEIARMLLQRGIAVVLECTYARTEQRASLVEALKGLPDVPLWVVECFISPDDAARRFKQRREATDLDEDLVRERAENFPYFSQAMRMDVASAEPSDLADVIATWLQRQPPAVDRDLWAEAGRAWS